MKKIAILLLALLSIISASSIVEKRDSESISEALVVRDDYFVRHLGDHLRVGYPSNTDIRERLRESGDQSSVWFNFLLAESSSNDSVKQEYYSRAIRRAQGNIGEMWVLFLEFYKLDDVPNQTTILDSLEYLAVYNGIESLPAISEQFEILAQKEFNDGNFDKASYCLDNSLRFSRFFIKTEVTSLAIPGSTSELYDMQIHLANEIKTNWRVQSTLIKIVVDSVLYIMKLIVFLLFLILMLRYSSSAIHSIVCLYPHGVSYKMRLFYTFFLLTIPLVFGVYPLLLLLTILIMRVPMKRSGVIAVRSLLILLMLYPSTTLLRNQINYSISENSPVSLYEEALYGQPTADLYQKITEFSENPNLANETKALHLTSRAIIQYKTGRIENAVQLIRKAYELWPDGEPVLMAAGNIYFSYGDSTQAIHIFQKAVELYPESPQSNQNFAQVNLYVVGFTDGTDYSVIAQQLDPRTIDTFFKRNNRFFEGKRLPPLRKFFLGAFPSKLYWQHFAAFSHPPEGSSNKMWGSTFFGFNVLLTFGLTVTALVLSSLIVPSFTQVKKSGHCVLCGKAVCKKCRINDTCNECHAMIHNISNEALVSSLKVKLSNGKRVVILLKAHIADTLFPGVRDLFLKKKSKKRIYFLLPITLLIYTIYGVVSMVVPDTIAAVATKQTLIIIAPGIIYNLLFLFINLRAALLGIKKRG